MVSTPVILRVRSGRHRAKRIRGPHDHTEQPAPMADTVRDRREEVLGGQDSRHQAAGGSGHGRVLRGAPRGRHQAQPQPRRGVQELATEISHPRQKHSSLPPGRAARHRPPPQEHRGDRRRVSPSRFQQPSLADHEKEYMSYR